MFVNNISEKGKIYRIKPRGSIFSLHQSSCLFLSNSSSSHEHHLPEPWSHLLTGTLAFYLCSPCSISFTSPSIPLQCENPESPQNPFRPGCLFSFLLLGNCQPHRASCSCKTYPASISLKTFAPVISLSFDTI